MVEIENKSVLDQQFPSSSRTSPMFKSWLRLQARPATLPHDE
jgi:hypothetical protein